MPESEQIEVSAVYARPEEQRIVTMRVPLGTTVEQFVATCAAMRKLPPVGEAPRFAIFGQVVEPTQKLRAGDRVEILRPLLVDPKEARRRAASPNRPREKSK
jgi:uncharacterized protein